MAWRPALLLLPLLAAALSGCTLPPEVQRFFDQVQGRPQFVDVERLNEEIAFAPTDAPSPGVPPSAQRTLNFTVAPGTTRLSIDVSVTFENPAPLPAPLPTGLPQGRVEVRVVPPGDQPTIYNFTENNAETYSAEPPKEGSWEVRVSTLGQGRVRVVALTTEPRP